MKKTILTLVFLAMVVFASAQEKTQQKGWKREGKTFVETKSEVMNGDTITAYYWRDAKGQEYPIILHRYTKGEKEGKVVAYVVRKSQKTGKEYRYYLPDGEKIAEEIINETK